MRVIESVIESVIETDYLVVGAGAAGMAFVDSLVDVSDADVVLVDRRHRPGGHWNDAYPFVRLHMPSTSYGVNSRPLGSDRLCTSGRDAGTYERASAEEICDYYQRVLDERLLPSGRVRFAAMCDHVDDGRGGHRLVSRLTGSVTQVRVRRKLVDARYLESSVPATHTPTFTADPGVRLVPPGGLVRLSTPASGYTVIGGGKTGMDTCQWLLDNGVAPTAIRWIRPRDLWLLNRAHYQPLTGLPAFFEGQARQVEAAARAVDVDDLFRRLEDGELLLRFDPTVEPSMLHGASASTADVDHLRRIENVVRGARVAHLGTDRVVLDEGTLPTDPGQVYVDCTAVGAPRRTGQRSIFSSDRITLQSVQMVSPPFSAALVAFVEATRASDAEKNRLCPSNPYPDDAVDWIDNLLTTYRAQAAWSGEPDLRAWLKDARLNRTSGAAHYRDDPEVGSARTRLSASFGEAIANLARLQSEVAGRRHGTGSVDERTLTGENAV